MAHPLSIRFGDPEVIDRLKVEAAVRGDSLSGLAEELIEEGLRMRRHPLVNFRDGATGRRASLIGGADIGEVIGGLVGGDVPVEDRVARSMEFFGLTADRIAAALDYYAEFTEEIDGEIAANVAVADELEARWLRSQQLLAG